MGGYFGVQFEVGTDLEVDPLSGELKGEDVAVVVHLLFAGHHNFDFFCVFLQYHLKLNQNIFKKVC